MVRPRKNLDLQRAVGRRLAAAREALEMRQIDLCDKLNVEQNAWSQYESGERMFSVHVAIRLADKFNVTLDWIYRGDLATISHALAGKIQNRIDKTNGFFGDVLDDVRALLEVINSNGKVLYCGPERRGDGSEEDYDGPERRRRAHVRRL